MTARYGINKRQRSIIKQTLKTDGCPAQNHIIYGAFIIIMIKRGELYYADLSPVVGSEQGGIRPVLVVQNDVGNKYSPTVIAAAVTSKLNKARLPTHIELDASLYGLNKDSVVLLEQIRTLDKRRLKERIGALPVGVMQRVDDALKISLGFEESVN